MLRVKTLDNESLTAMAGKLQQKCEQFNPDLIIGIATGGEYLADMMFQGTKHIAVKCQRPSTGSKSKGWKKRLLQSLPIWLLDLARMAESLALRHKKHPQDPPCLDTDAVSAIAQAHRVLIIDDAVDSGSTLLAVKNAVTACAASGAQIKSAVLTVTTPHPLIHPDYFIYDNLTLLRFPWSTDMKPTPTKPQ